MRPASSSETQMGNGTKERRTLSPPSSIGHVHASRPANFWSIVYHFRLFVGACSESRYLIIFASSSFVCLFWPREKARCIITYTNEEECLGLRD